MRWLRRARCRHRRVYFHSTKAYLNSSSVVGYCQECGGNTEVNLGFVHAESADRMLAVAEEALRAKGWTSVAGKPNVWVKQ